MVSKELNPSMPICAAAPAGRGEGGALPPQEVANWQTKGVGLGWRESDLVHHISSKISCMTTRGEPAIEPSAEFGNMQFSTFLPSKNLILSFEGNSYSFKPSNELFQLLFIF